MQVEAAARWEAAASHPGDEEAPGHRGDTQDRVEDREGKGAVLGVREATHAQSEDLRCKHATHAVSARAATAATALGAWATHRHSKRRAERQEGVGAHRDKGAVASDGGAEPADEGGNGAEEQRRAQVERVDHRPNKQSDGGAQQAVERVEHACLHVREAKLVG